MLRAKIAGKNYQEIAEELGKSPKTIDNALQRVKRKIEKYMEARGNDVDLSMIYKGLTTINRRLNNNDDDLI